MPVVATEDDHIVAPGYLGGKEMALAWRLIKWHR